jgi:hypothetical protein
MTALVTYNKTTVNFKYFSVKGCEYLSNCPARIRETVIEKEIYFKKSSNDCERMRDAASRRA